jgi:pseudaminic acid cytidylyltransferase
VKAIAIIPARGGSKRIPKKNIKSFHGKPLIAYSIETALESKLFSKVVVTTDDKEIAKVAKEYGADVPFVRPPELSDDYTGTAEVIKHAVEFLKQSGEEFDYVCTIYATAPLLRSQYLVEGFEKIKSNDIGMVFSATSMPFPIQRTFKIVDNKCEMFTPEHYYSRSQDLEEAFQDAGQFYWEKRDRELRDIAFGKDSMPVILPRHLVQDIDTIEDWQRAEYMYEVANRDKFDEWNKIKKRVDNKKVNEFMNITLSKNRGNANEG